MHARSSARDLARQVGDSTKHLARRVSDSTVVLARRVGPRRGLIGLAILGAVVVGSVFLVRYLRRRSEQEGDELEATEDPSTVAGRRARKLSRAKRRAAQPPITH